MSGPGGFETPGTNPPSGDHNNRVPLSLFPKKDVFDIKYSHCEDGKVIKLNYHYELLHPGDDSYESRLANIVQKSSISESRPFSILPGQFSVCWSWVDEMIYEAGWL